MCVSRQPGWRDTHTAVLHAGTMNVGDPDGYGEFGVLDEDAGGLLCHECGRRFSHLGLHA